MPPPDDRFKDAYQKYVKAAKKAYTAGSTKADLDNAYELYLKCAVYFWEHYDVMADNLPAEHWEHFFAFMQTHSCVRPGHRPFYSCFGTLGSIGTYGTFGGCVGTAGTFGTFGTRGG
jgi:hypothetical protein